MKTIVVSGARSHVGKTSLVRALCGLLPGAVPVKIGHHIAKPGKPPNFFPMGTSFQEIRSTFGDAAYLIIESNQILREMTPDCAIYLGADNPKPSALTALEKADVVRGERISLSRAERLADRLGCSRETVLAIIGLAGAVVE